MYKEALQKANSIAIISHISPDGDTLGSSLALASALKKMGKEVDLFCDSVIPDKFLFLEGADEYKTEMSKVYDLCVAIDCADESRLGRLKNGFSRAKDSINIDHHTSNTRFAKINVLRECAATSGIIFDVIKDMGWEFDANIATLLYLALLTDTGGFLHTNTTPCCLRLAAQLIELGADSALINYKMLKETPLNRLNLLGRAIASIKTYEDNRVAIMILRLEDFALTDTLLSDTEGIVNYAVNLEGVDVGICLSEQNKGQFKIAFRSHGKVNVAEIAKIFGGGGHVGASGCMLCGDIYDIVDKLLHATRTQLPF